MQTTHNIGQKIWALCHILRDDGITYQDYVTELTWLLFLKMAQETNQESHLPEGYRWSDLEAKKGIEQLVFYQEMLLHLSTDAKGRIQAIFADASTSLRQHRNLRRLVQGIDGLDWYSAREEGLGDMYEGLLERNASEQKSGAGQYFTPRPLIDCMVALVQPQSGERIQDPACGTGGFLIAADRFIKERTGNLLDLSEEEQIFQRRDAFSGVELVPGAHRLSLMNAMLHGIEGAIDLGDSLSSLGTYLQKADVILTNPPFGTKKAGRALRSDFRFPTRNKQLAFLQHVYRGLKPGGRAAVILPDNVLFEESLGKAIRADLMDKCNLHTLLRLPTGIFYAQGVKTNILFFQRAAKENQGKTKRIWVYDLRANMNAFGRRNPLTRRHFSDFEKAFGKDPNGKSPRRDQGERGRFRSFTREEIAARGDNLDISWLKDRTVEEELGEPDEVADNIMASLRIATKEMEVLVEILKSEDTLT